MAANQSLDETIEDLATAPREFEADGQKVQERSLRELIEADKYLTQKKRAQSGKPPFRVQQVTRRSLW